MWASFEFLMSGLLFGRRGGGMKKAGTGVVGWSRLVGVGRWGRVYPHIPTPPHRRGGRCSTILHSPHPDTPPISTHTAEDALEGLYFVDRRILRCLPCFFRKTRPRASYELLEAFSPSWGRCGVTSGVWRAPSPISHSPHPDIPISPTSTRMP